MDVSLQSWKVTRIYTASGSSFGIPSKKSDICLLSNIRVLRAFNLPNRMSPILVVSQSVVTKH